MSFVPLSIICRRNLAEDSYEVGDVTSLTSRSAMFTNRIASASTSASIADVTIDSGAKHGLDVACGSTPTTGQITGAGHWLVERPPEVRQYPQSHQIDAYQRLKARDDADPPRRPHRVFIRLYPGQPRADIQIAPTDVKSGEDAELQTIPTRSIERREPA